MNNLFSVKDQVVVITGGTGVLGSGMILFNFEGPLGNSKEQTEAHKSVGV